MITDKDIKKLKSVFATKDDLNRFATKDDLRSSVSEIIEYINANSEGNREEMKQYVQKLANEISSVLTNHEGRIKDLEKHYFPAN